MAQGTIWNILGMIGLTPWTQGSFFYFPSPCWLATSRNTGWMDIHEIFRIWTQEAIGYTVSCSSSKAWPMFALSECFLFVFVRSVGNNVY